MGFSLPSGLEIKCYFTIKLKKFDQKNILNKRGSLQELFAKSGVNKVKELPIIIKGDAQGSVEAIISSLNKLEHPEVKVRILHKGTGGINPACAFM